MTVIRIKKRRTNSMTLLAARPNAHEGVQAWDSNYWIRIIGFELLDVSR
jgi:hypothetical protein